jgi:hypothetical protein
MREKEERGGVGESSKVNRHGYVHRLDKSATSYFFTNFPDDVKAVDMWPRFARFGRVGEVFIPAKVDKQGKRFGFVKFREVKDATELLRCISNIWIDSFKLRINLSKFNRKTEPANKDERKQTVGLAEANRTVRSIDGKSFKAVLLAEEVDGRRVGAVEKVVPEVLWEVEAEEERLMKLEGACVGYLIEKKDAQTIQNDFNMNGFQGLKVCAFGHLQILLWSEKIGEVEEVMSTVGWWCSMFEKLVPWSPELVVNSRVAWLRCYGVPTHAWGNNLFRSIAFKHGRFIEVDGNTKEMRRCDVARIKIVTNFKAMIDSSMAVKVLGRRFDIRIMEEVGEVSSTDWSGVKGGVRWPDNLSSRASGDGASIQAVVEGFSETGSEDDTSESCQVLLGLEAQGIRRIETVASTRVLETSEEDMADNIPIFLGNSEELVDTVVNFDVDKRDDVAVVSEGKELRLEGVRICVDGGAQEDDVHGLDGLKDGLAESVEQVDLGDPVLNNGPARQENWGGDVDRSEEGGVKRLLETGLGLNS